MSTSLGFTDDELNNFKMIFEVIDKEHTGYISLDQLKEMLTSFQFSPLLGKYPHFPNTPPPADQYI